VTAPRTFVALGDSITNAEGSWAELLAGSLGLELVNLAQDGQVASGLVRDQLPRVPARVALAALYVGVNDARSTAWDPIGFAAAVDEILTALDPRAERLLVLTVPGDLGRPVAGPDAYECAALLRRAAGRHGATLVELADFGGARHVWPDHVHPTPAGQLEIARRAARALGVPEPDGDGRPPRPDRYARELVRDGLRRVRESGLSPPARG
jgi:lysophospholipase L1-like esterase